MTQDRIAYFENLLSQPMADPHRSWIAELLDAVKGKADAVKPAKAKGNHATATVPVIDTPENTDA